MSNPRSAVCAATTKYMFHSLNGSYERWLGEQTHPDPGTAPTRQYEWSLNGVLEAKGYPHLICFACHEVPNTTGLIRSEMMILTSLMIAQMRRTMDNLHETYPVCHLSLQAIDILLLTECSRRS